MSIRNNKGFTLAELLIVVAIIGVLVSISMPIFSTQLEKAKQAADLANMRAGQAAAVSEYLLEGGYGGEYKYNFDANSGKVTTDVPDGYGKSRELIYNGVKHEPLDKYVVVTINNDSILVEWSNSGTPITNNGGNTISGGGGIDVPPTPPADDDEGDGEGGSSDSVINMTSKEYATNTLSQSDPWPIGGTGRLNYHVGDIFTYNGNLYYTLADTTEEYNQYFSPTPEILNRFVVFSNNKVLTDSDVVTGNDGVRMIMNIKHGDIYVDENNVAYLYRNGDAYSVNIGDTGSWIRLN